jgi:hypothetical protein
MELCWDYMQHDVEEEVAAVEIRNSQRVQGMDHESKPDTGMKERETQLGVVPGTGTRELERLLANVAGTDIVLEELATPLVHALEALGIRRESKRQSSNMAPEKPLLHTSVAVVVLGTRRESKHQSLSVVPEKPLVYMSVAVEVLGTPRENRRQSLSSVPAMVHENRHAHSGVALETPHGSKHQSSSLGPAMVL